MTDNITCAQDWLAYIPMGAGGSWARGKDRDDTIKRCVKIAKSDWGELYDLRGATVDMLVADVRGHERVCFDSSGVWVEPDDSDGSKPSTRHYLARDRVQVIQHTYPGKPKKARRT